MDFGYLKPGSPLPPVRQSDYVADIRPPSLASGVRGFNPSIPNLVALLGFGAARYGLEKGNPAMFANRAKKLSATL